MMLFVVSARPPLRSSTTPSSQHSSAAHDDRNGERHLGRSPSRMLRRERADVGLAIAAEQHLGRVTLIERQRDHRESGAVPEARIRRRPIPALPFIAAVDHTPDAAANQTTICRPSGTQKWYIVGLTNRSGAPRDEQNPC